MRAWPQIRWVDIGKPGNATRTPSWSPICGRGRRSILSMAEQKGTTVAV